MRRDGAAGRHRQMAQVVARASQLPSDQSTRLGSARKGLGAHRTEARALERWAARGEPCQRGQRLQEPRRALSLPPPYCCPYASPYRTHPRRLGPRPDRPSAVSGQTAPVPGCGSMGSRWAVLFLRGRAWRAVKG